MKKVLIVGCGVVGAACAYFLRKADCQVTMIEQGAFGMGCSHANCGFVSPSHVLPLAVPGAVRSTMKAMLQPDSPFSVRPGLNFSLWKWLIQFAGKCNDRAMEGSARAIHALLQSSRRLYQEIIDLEGFDVDWETKGLLFVFQSQPALEHHGDVVAWLRAHMDIQSERYEGHALCQLEPALKPGLAGGWHYPGDAHLRPDKLMTAWHAWLTKNDVTLQENCRLLELNSENGKVHSVKTSQGDLEADDVILATGAWTPLMQQQLRCKIPIQPGKGYSMTMDRPNPCPKIPMLFEEHRVAATPFASGYRLGSIMEFIGYDATLNRHRLEFLTHGAQHYLHAPRGEPVVEEWWGWRPMTYDSVPIIGPAPAFANVTLATGHSMLGLSMAPGTGKLVSELVLGQPPHVDPVPYAVTRF
jgi:D-amino-acid dehydrogenase